jgi:hypothetical protein
MSIGKDTEVSKGAAAARSLTEIMVSNLFRARHRAIMASGIHAGAGAPSAV